MSNRIYSNDIKGVRTENSEGLVYGRGHMFEQADLGCLADNVSPEQNNQNTTTTRKGKNRKYSKEENMLIMECYLYSNPSRLGYRKRMLELWNSKSLFFITKQWLFHQANNVHKRGWLIEIELEERERKLELDNDNRNDTDPDNVAHQETNTGTMSEEEPSFEQVDEAPYENQDAW